MEWFYAFELVGQIVDLMSNVVRYSAEPGNIREPVVTRG